MFRVAQIVLIIVALALAAFTTTTATADVSDLRQLPSADLNSGLGYELLLAAIEGMQQDIMDTRQEVKEQRQLFEAAKAEIDRKQQTMEQKVQEVLKRSLMDLNKQIQALLRKDKSSAEQLQKKIDQLGNSTEQAVIQLKQSVKQELIDMEKRIQQKITEQSRATPSPFERSNRNAISSSIPNVTLSVDNRMYPSCQEAQTRGIVRIRLQNTGIPSFKVLCEQNLWGSWMVIHRRYDGSLDFNRDWSDYRDGFGSMDSEYWLGLDKMHRITSSGTYELLIAMKRFDDSVWYALYQQIVIGSSAEQFKLQLTGFYQGSVADSMATSNGMPFSTPDVDNDMVPGGSCAEVYHSGWWFNKCFGANLNGVYGFRKVDNTMQWNGFGDKECLKEVMMMIRPSQNAIQRGATLKDAGSGYFFSQHSFSSSTSRFP